MATTIKLKSGSGAPLAGDLVAAEPAFDLTNKRLYTEDSGGSVIEVGTNPTNLTTGTFTSTGIDDNATSTAITINSSENVNIGAVGTTTLTTLTGPFNGDVVKMDGSSGVSDRHLIFSNSSNSQQWDIDAEGGASSLGVLSFSTNSTERMRILNNGNVGIGTSSLSAPLTVSRGVAENGLVARLYAYEASITDRGLEISTDSSGGRVNSEITYNAESGAATGQHVWQTDGTERMRIDSSGNVGIGTSSPSQLLHLSSTGAVKQRYTRSANSTDISLASNGMFNADNLAGTGFGWYNNSSEAMRIDASGNVGIGTTTPNDSLEVSNGKILVSQSIFRENGMECVSSDNLHIFADNTNLGTSSYIYFSVDGSEAMRLDSSGNVMVGTTISGTPTNGIVLYKDSNRGILKAATTLSAADAVASFYNPNGKVGQIITNGSTTAYQTSSDQRLKENIVDAPSASGDIDAIQVRSFDWKIDGAHQKYGMIAQELQSISPEAVSAQSDPEEMLGVDYSKLVPMMIKEIQDLRARVAQLEGE